MDEIDSNDQLGVSGSTLCERVYVVLLWKLQLTAQGRRHLVVCVYVMTGRVS